MKLNNYLYKIEKMEIVNDIVTYTISLISGCPIYSAHFPEMPITPGVCQIQMITELAEDFVNKHLLITGIKNAKFVSALIPNNRSIKVTLTKLKQEDNQIKIQAVIADDTTIYAKLSLQTVIA